MQDRMDDIEQFDKFFKNSPYSSIRLLLTASGLWPFHTLRRRCTIYIAMILVIGSGFIFQALAIMDVWNDPNELMDYLPELLLVTENLMKTVYAVYALPKIKLLMISMRKYYISSKSDEETKIYISHTLYGRKLVHIYTGFILLSPIMVESMTLLSNINEESKKNASSNTTQETQTELPYRANYLIDIDTYYIPIAIHMAVYDVCVTFLILICDVLLITSVEYCCGLFEGLRYRLENALNSENNIEGLIVTQDTSYSNIAYSIQRHTETIQFVAIMESIFSFPIFINMGIIIFNLGVLEYQMATTKGIINFIQSFAYLGGLLLNIFIENWLGQKIIDSSEKVYESAYNTKWYDMPIATRKLLIMVMMSSKKPMMCTIGKIFALSYLTFNAVVRASTSYFMLLQSVQ